MKSFHDAVSRKHIFHQDNPNQVPQPPREKATAPNTTSPGNRPQTPEHIQPRKGGRKGPFELHLERGMVFQPARNGAVITVPSTLFAFLTRCTCDFD